MANLWYKNAVIYCLDVEKYMDSTGDGIGDFAGLADRLDHLERLGVNCIWLNPFFPSPNRDNGYDITDYYGVDPRYGTLGDFVEFIHAARDRGMRVITDLVVNHTSIDHPWFQEARKDPDSPYRDWYVWRKEKPENIEEGIVFPGVQKAVWTYDEVAKAWYMHRFYKHQPDLNVTNPEVCKEILKIMGFWLELGVSGFRIDAVPFLVENFGLESAEHIPPQMHVLSEMHDFMSWRKAQSILLAEANIPYPEATEYFDAGDRMSLIFDFQLNQQMFLSFAQRSATSVRRALERRPRAPGMGQWAVFLRNHDEIDLGRLTEEERALCFSEFGPQKNMQVYERGLRRRMATMFGGDQDRIRLGFSLLLSLPGTPVIWYGEEIGMGENLSEPEREAVRTPMQWSDEPNAGFSKALAKDLVSPVRRDGDFGYAKINIAQQIQDSSSQFHAVQQMIAARRATPEIGWGDWEIVDLGNDDVLVLSFKWRGNRIATVHNFTDGDVSIKFEIDGVKKFNSILMDNGNHHSIKAGEKLTLGRYGFAWFRCDGERR